MSPHWCKCNIISYVEPVKFLKLAQHPTNVFQVTLPKAEISEFYVDIPFYLRRVANVCYLYLVAKSSVN